MNRPALAAGVAAAAVLLTACAGPHSGHAAAAPAPPATSSTAATTSSPATATPASASPAGTVEIDVAIAGGQVSTAQSIVDVPLGAPVLLVVASDQPDTVHVHGYDMEGAASPENPLRLTFEATIPGVFEVEMHSSGLQLLRLRVG